MKDIARGNNDLIGVIGLVGNSHVHNLDWPVSDDGEVHRIVEIAMRLTFEGKLNMNLILKIA